MDADLRWWIYLAIVIGVAWGTYVNYETISEITYWVLTPSP